MQTREKCLAAFVFILATLFFFGTAHALNYSIYDHSITIQIGTDGKDSVVEKYFINFPDDFSKIAFREQSLQLGSSVQQWKNFDPLFNISLGQNTQNQKISYNEGDPNYLQISYDLPESFMATGKDATMLTEYDVKVNYFNSFYQSGLWIIPEHTRISVELPPGAEIRDTIEPQATITTNGTRKVVTWQGYQSATKLALSYVVWKKIEPVIDLSTMTTFLFKTEEGMLLILAIIIILLVIAWQRKKIGNRIEGFVENHSVIREE